MIVTDETIAITILKKLAVEGNPVFSDTESGVLPAKLSDMRSNIKSLPYPDLRGTGVYPNLRVLSLYEPNLMNTPIILDLDHIEIDNLKEYIKPLHTVWANAPFDFSMLGYTTDKFDDVQLAIRTAYPKLPNFKLDTIARELAGDPHSGIDKAKAQKSFQKGVPLTDEQIEYAKADVIALARLYKLPAVQAVMNLLFYKVDMYSLKYSIKYQQNGLLVHKPSLEEEMRVLPSKVAKNEAILKGVNPNSSKQVKEYLNGKGLQVDSTDKDTLIRLMNTTTGELHDVIKAIFDQRRLLKRVKMLDSYNYDKVYTHFNPYGAGTGRFTSSGKNIEKGINAQQIPRDLQYIFNQDTDDTVVIHADYSTAELRAACSIMGDHTMRKYLLEGKDLHKISAMLADTSLTYETVTKEDRQKGKAVSFGFIFGMSADTFKEYAYSNYNVLFNDAEAQGVKRAYGETYKDITRYHLEKWKTYKNTPNKSPLGRLAMARLGTDAINFSVQAGIGETTKLAIHYLVRDYGEKVLDYIYNVVHDAIYLRVPRGEEEKWTKALTSSMLLAWSEIVKVDIFQFKDIPMGVEYEVGDRVQEIFDMKDFRWNTN